MTTITERIETLEAAIARLEENYWAGRIDSGQLLAGRNALIARCQDLEGELRGRVLELREESGLTGDIEQVWLCVAALAGDEQAMAACAQVLADAEAMLGT